MFIKLSKYILILEGFQIPFAKNEPKAYYRIICILINHPTMTYGLMKNKMGSHIFNKTSNITFSTRI
jgi:hypothetical protein